MKHEFPVWNIPSRNNEEQDYLSTFHWNDPKSRLPFTFQTDFLETFCKWYGNNYCLIITGRSIFQSFDFLETFCTVYCLLFIVLFAKNYTNQIKSNYLNSHGEEAQEKPPGL